MNGKRNATLAVVGILVTIGALSSIGIRLGFSIEEGRTDAQAAFNELVPAFGAPGSTAGLADRARRLALVNLYDANPRLLAVWVTDRDRGILWKLPDRSPYLPTSENFSRSPRVRAPGLTTKIFHADWSGDGRRADIGALYVILSQESAFVIFRDAAIGLGAWGLLVLFIVLIGGKESEEVRWRPASRQSEGSTAAALDEGTEEIGRPSGTEIASSFNDEEFAKTNEDDSPLGGFSRPDAFEIPELDEGETEAPDLYSPASGLGYSSWLEERLGGELARAAGIEQDLSLLVVDIDSLSPVGDEYSLVTQILREFFSFRDLAFERGERGFSVILPNLDASHALRMAEEFHKKLTIQLQDREDSSPRSAPPIYMGLSSRAGRLVEARRLIDEAGLALERAREEDDSKIVAFKPDPDKYRLWLASMGGY